MKTDNYEKIQDRLKWLYINAPHFIHGGGHNIKSNEEKICTIEINQKKNLGIIAFDRWVDNKIFFDTSATGKFIKKPEYKDLPLRFCSGGSSFILEFSCKDTKITKQIIEILIENGYTVGYSDEEEE